MSAKRDPIFGCLLAQGRLDKSGYAYHGKSRAHIVAWEAAHGPRPIKDGAVLELDHTCRRPSCQAVHHLEPVTARENQLRKSWAYRAAMKVCQFGHSMADAIVTDAMGRVCRSCNRIASKAPAIAQVSVEGASRTRMTKAPSSSHGLARASRKASAKYLK